MNTLYVTQQVRPLRIAFLFGHKKSDLLEAIALNTILWGGIYNPVIETGKSASARMIRKSLGIIKDFDPDLIVNLSSVVPPKFKSALENGDRKIIAKTEFLEPGPNGLKFKHSLATFGAFNSEIPGSGLPEDWKNKARILLPKDDISKSYVASVYGYLNKEMFPWAEKYLTKDINLPAEKISIKNDLSRLKHFEPHGPIYITTFGLEVYAPQGGLASNLIFVGDPSNKKDLIEYWNLRAAGENIFFLPTQNYQEFEDGIKDFFTRFSEPLRFNSPDIEVAISPSCLTQEDKFKEVADWVQRIVGSSITRVPFLVNWGRRHKRVVEEVICAIPYHSREKTLANYSTEEVSPFSLAHPKFLDEKFDRREMAWAVDLSFIGFYDKNFTIDLPNQKGMYELAWRELTFSHPGDVRISERGLVRFGESTDDVVHINPLPVSKVISKLFENIDIKISPSTPGVFANKILQMMGGLDKCRVFKIKGVREALNALNTDEAEITINEKRHRGRISKPHPLPASTIKDIVKNTQQDVHGSVNWIADLYEDLTLYYGQGRPLTPEIVLDFLITKKLISPGIELECVECKTKNWYKLGSFSEKLKCPYCGFERDIPRPDDRDIWKYRSEGMVSITDEGRGSLPVILSIWRLAHNNDLGESKFITSQNIEGISETGFKAEVDYVFFTLGHFSKQMELILGEARNYSEFKPRDIRKVIKLAKKFKNKPFIAFTTLKDAFSNREKELLKQVMKEGFMVFAFTRQEIDPYDLYKRFEGLKDKYAVRLEELSLNLCELNLDIKPEEVDKLVNAKEYERIHRFMSIMDERAKNVGKKTKKKLS